MNEQDFEQLTLFREDSPASPSVWLESKREKKMIVTYGLKCSELSENLRRVGSLVKMYLELSRLPAGEWCRIWSRQGMTWSYSILKLRLSELHTEEQELHLWPTATVNGNYNREKDGTKSGNGLATAVKRWPTPTASCGQAPCKHGDGGPDLATKIGGQLNPTWVEWLMGFPIGWTDLNASETP